MILKRVLIGAAAAGAFAAGGAAIVVSACYALFAWARDHVGPSGAAAIVALVLAVLFLALGLILALKAGAARKEPSAGEKAMGFLREKPLIAAAVALAASVFVVKNPSMVMAMALAFLEGKSSKK